MFKRTVLSLLLVANCCGINAMSKPAKSNKELSKKVTDTAMACIWKAASDKRARAAAKKAAETAVKNFLEALFGK